MDAEKIGIVTVLYNSETVLDDFFKTLNEQTYTHIMLYVIDNKSPDDSLGKSKELAKTAWFKTAFIENDANYGVAKGNNQGIEAALRDQCDYVLLSNNDVVLQPDTIKNLYAGLQAHKADMAVPKIYYYGTKKIWSAGGKFNTLKGSTKHIGIRQEDRGQYEYDNRVAYSPTCFMLMSKAIFSVVGLMDEAYFVYADDVDFCYRAKQKGQQLWYIYTSVLEHKESVSTGKKSDFSVYYMMRNKILFAKKHRKFFLLFYIEYMIYHYTFRNMSMIKNRHQWKILTKALKDAFKL